MDYGNYPFENMTRYQYLRQTFRYHLNQYYYGNLTRKGFYRIYSDYLVKNKDLLTDFELSELNKEFVVWNYC
jgi:hypothetical protein